MEENKKGISGQALFRRIIHKTLLSVLMVFVVLIMAGGIYFLMASPYEADEVAMETLTTGHEAYRIETLEDKTICFIPNNDDIEAALIFYPGGGVEYEAYATLLGKLAEENVMCLLVHMPLNYAIFDIDAAEELRNRFTEVENWYIGGHSLGGAMAASYIDSHSEEYEGLLLLAAYSIKDLTDTDLKTLLIYGSNDEVLNHNNLIRCMKYLPNNYSEYVIEGGCHAFFGNYGRQKGDGEPEISVEEQQEQTASEIIEFIKE